VLNFEYKTYPIGLGKK